MWNLDKIQKIISDQREESINLEYKSAKALDKKKKIEISKDVSAFANSGGGIIIYGISEDNDNRLPNSISPIKANEFSKEWLEDVITSNIAPTINKLEITSVPVDKENDNLVAYVVEIPQSYTAHQAKDRKYYKRHNFKSEPMEDWEIRDVMNRNSTSKVSLYFRTDDPNRFLAKLNNNLKVELWVSNEGDKVVEYLECYMTGDSRIARQIKRPDVCGNFEEYFSNNLEHQYQLGDKLVTIGVSRQAILPSTSKRIGIFEVTTAFPKSDLILSFQISTEDNTIYSEYKAKDIFSWEHRLN